MLDQLFYLSLLCCARTLTSKTLRDIWWKVRAIFADLELRSRTIPVASPMPEETGPTDPPQAPPPVICPGAPRQRDPPVFNGTDDHDVEDWLSSYDRVSVHNKWNEADKLSYVPFYLSGVAHLWFRNHEADFATWAAFRTKLQEVFGRPAVRKLRAEQQLRCRAQQKGENFTSYIEDVVDLCRRINPSMAEEEKIKNILKGIEDDAFQMLLAKNPQTVNDLITLCQSYEELRKQRLSTRRALVPDAVLSALSDSTSSAPSSSAMLDQIKQFVREEVARQLSLLPATQASESYLPPELRQVIHEQVAEVVPPAHQPPPTPVPLTYASVVATPRPPSAAMQYRRQSAFASPPHAATRYAPTGSYWPSQQPVRPDRQYFPQSPPPVLNPWRTQDNRPICYSCGFPGHVARFCQRRGWYPPETGRPRSTGPASSYRSEAAVQHFDTSPHASRTFNSRRSPSPRRRSLSPLIRRPEAIQEEN